MKKYCVLLLCFCLIITGCGNKNTENNSENKTIVDSVVLHDEKTGVLITSKNKDITDESIIKVESKSEDYTKLNDTIEKAMAFDIKIFDNNNKEVSVTSEIEVMLEIPDEYSKDNLVVYYVVDNKIKETFNVEVKDKEGISYASFKTNHLSIYVLAELKEVEKKEDKDIHETVTKEEKQENKVESTNSNNQGTSGSNNKNNSNNNSPLKTINLVGAWKVDGGSTIMVYNSDGTGQLIHYISDEPIFVSYVWGLNGVSLYTAYDKQGYGNGTSDITIVDENTFKLRNGTVYKRYYGDIPKEVVKVYYTGTYTIDVEVRKIPDNLQVTKKYTATYKFRTEDKNVYDKAINNNTYGFVDASNCVAAGVYTLNVNLMDTPKDIEYLSGVSVIEVELVEK